MQMFGTFESKSHIKCITKNMDKQLSDKTDGNSGTAMQSIYVLTMASWKPNIEGRSLTTSLDKEVPEILEWKRNLSKWSK